MAKGFLPEPELLQHKPGFLTTGKIGIGGAGIHACDFAALEMCRL
jgi:hypothetical protein